MMELLSRQLGMLTSWPQHEAQCISRSSDVDPHNLSGALRKMLRPAAAVAWKEQRALQTHGVW